MSCHNPPPHSPPSHFPSPLCERENRARRTPRRRRSQECRGCLRHSAYKSGPAFQARAKTSRPLTPEAECRAHSASTGCVRRPESASPQSARPPTKLSADIPAHAQPPLLLLISLYLPFYLRLAWPFRWSRSLVEFYL